MVEHSPQILASEKKATTTTTTTTMVTAEPSFAHWLTGYSFPSTHPLFLPYLLSVCLSLSMGN